MASQGKHVAYYRVSTDKQGASGLGIEAQRAAVASYLNGGNWNLIAEFVEVESGKRSDRPQLEAALMACRLHGARLVIARLNRLSRDAHFLLGLDKARVDFVAADMPHANRLTVGIMALVAEEERRMISANTKAALQAAKARGTKLGGRRHKIVGRDAEDKPIYGELACGSAEARVRAAAAIQKRATDRASDIAPTIRQLRAGGAVSLRAIAAGLNEAGITTARGHSAWDASQVRRVLQRNSAMAAS